MIFFTCLPFEPLIERILCRVRMIDWFKGDLRKNEIDGGRCFKLKCYDMIDKQPSH